MNTLEFVLYRNMEHQELFDSMAKLLDQEEGAELDVYRKTRLQQPNIWVASRM